MSRISVNIRLCPLIIRLYQLISDYRISNQNISFGIRYYPIPIQIRYQIIRYPVGKNNRSASLVCMLISLLDKVRRWSIWPLHHHIDPARIVDSIPQSVIDNQLLVISRNRGNLHIVRFLCSLRSHLSFLGSETHLTATFRGSSSCSN